MLYTPMTTADDPIDLQSPVDFTHPDARGLMCWWLVLPGLNGGLRWTELVRGASGVLTGGPYFTGSVRPGGYGQVSFDGSDDRVVIANKYPLIGGAETISVWVYGTSWSANKTIFANQNGASDNNMTVEIGRTANRISVLHTGSAVHTGANNVPGTNQWFHIACVRTGSSGSWSISSYINGLLDSTTNSIGTNPYPLDTPNVWIGGNPNISGRYLGGAVDDLRVYSRGLSASEIYQLYQNSKAFNPGLLTRITPMYWFGDTSTEQTIAPSSIQSEEVFGSPIFSSNPLGVAPASIPSAEVFGIAQLSSAPLSIAPASIQSGELFGNTVLSSAPLGIAPSSIQSGELFGIASLSSGSLGISPSSIQSGELFGIAVFSASALSIAPASIMSGELFGTAEFTVSPEIPIAYIPFLGIVGTERTATGVATSQVLDTMDTERSNTGVSSERLQ